MGEQREVEIGDTVKCSEEYGVTTVTTRGGAQQVCRKEPCPQCPWRKDVPTGVFPPKAFQTSAPTAYDAAMSTFACHMSGAKMPATCAGFLMRHAENNLGVRLGLAKDRIELERVTDGGLPLYESYREMAIANGVDPDDPVLRPVRANGKRWDSGLRRWVRFEE